MKHYALADNPGSAREYTAATARRLFLFSAVTALAVGGIAVAASPDPVQIVQARQNYFKSLGGVMKPMVQLAGTFDAEAAKAEAAKLDTLLAIDRKPFFALGTSDADLPGRTRAKAAIWENFEDFSTKLHAFEEAGDALVVAAGQGDASAFGAAFGKFGATCKSCHDAYRLPD